MPASDTYVRACIEVRAAEALEAMGLSILDAIRLLMVRIADERRLPFEIEGAECRNSGGHCRTRGGKGPMVRRRRRPDGRSALRTIERSSVFYKREVKGRPP
jgi:DNA-damage-inducible protein J